jgi:hypothetical protein
VGRFQAPQRVLNRRLIRRQRLGDLGGNRWSALIDEEAVHLDANSTVDCLLGIHRVSSRCEFAACSIANVPPP